MAPNLQPIPEFLERVQLAPRQAHKTLTLWPLLLRADATDLGRAAAYLPLADALGAGTLEIDEVDASGSVPHARVRNSGAEAVLVLFGEELLGAKQDRVANASFLVAPQSELVIDVTCIEQGRWSRRSTRAASAFLAGAGVFSSTIRRRMVRQVSRARAAGGGFWADQGEVWEEVGERIAWSQTESPSHAYADYLKTREGDLVEISSAFSAVPRQVGFVAAIGDTVAGLEAVGDPKVFERVFPRLLRSYAVDAADAFQVSQASCHENGQRFDAPEPFLEALAAASVKDGPSLGLGRDLRVQGEGVEGCALATETVVHLSVFPALA